MDKKYHLEFRFVNGLMASIYDERYTYAWDEHLADKDCNQIYLLYMDLLDE